jgi:hypothetical protein
MQQKPFLKITIAALLTVLVSVNSALRIAQNYLRLGRFVPPRILIIVAIIYLIIVLIYLFTKARKASRDPNRATELLAFWEGALRFVIAFDICVFGVGKFFDIQRNVPIIWSDTPYGLLASWQMFWSFFGHFYAFQRIIGVVEIAGSIMLLFRKTRLFGIIFLLPLALNILLLDSFYLKDTVYYIAMIALGLIYLLLIEYPRLVKFFFEDKSDLPQYQFKSIILKTALRLVVIIGPFLLMATHKYPQYYPNINGKYEVKSLIVNNVPQNINACRDSILTKIYIDKDDFVFEYNSYQRRWIGDYKYNEATGQITATWNYPHPHAEQLIGKILPGKRPDEKILTGHMGKELLTINMQRADQGK